MADEFCSDKPTFTITNVTQTSGFKKMLKKYKHDKRAMESLKQILNCYKQGKQPNQRYNCHMLSGGNDKGLMDCHLKSTAIILIFNIENNDTIQLLRIGNHKELGVQ